MGAKCYQLRMGALKTHFTLDSVTHLGHVYIASFFQNKLFQKTSSEKLFSKSSVPTRGKPQNESETGSLMWARYLDLESQESMGRNNFSMALARSYFDIAAVVCPHTPSSEKTFRRGVIPRGIRLTNVGKSPPLV